MFFDHLRSESADHSPKPHNQDHGRCGIHGYTHRHLEAYTAHYSMIGRFSGFERLLGRDLLDAWREEAGLVKRLLLF